VAHAPVALTSGPNGVLWFLNGDNGADVLGRFSPSGPATEFPVPNFLHSDPRAITVQPDGTVWFIDQLGYVGRITPAGLVSEFPLPTDDHTIGQMVGNADGTLWFADGGRLGRIATSGAVTEIALPARASLEGMTVGPNIVLWGTDTASNAILRIQFAHAGSSLPS
jgi:virginiamycin B lyase